MERVDALVIGAGVIGLSCARRLAQAGLDTLLVECNASFGAETSARNSEVIHAGLYYPPGSWKERLCIAGRNALYRYAEDHPVAIRKTGKWIVAISESQRNALMDIHANAVRLGVPCDWVAPDRVSDEAPALNAELVLESPETGIIDSHALMLSLLGDFERAGGTYVCCASVGAVTRLGHGFCVRFENAAHGEVAAGVVVNAAGHGAVAIAQALHGQSNWLLPDCRARGHYFSYSGQCPFSRLIYPVPEPGGLGIHLTLDLAGNARFGPDVEWVEELDYSVDESRKGRFVEAIRSYWPDCDPNRLSPAYAGIRPKLGTPDNFLADFLIAGPEQHGVPGIVHLLGIESPGLTACLPMAEVVADILRVAHPGND